MENLYLRTNKELLEFIQEHEKLSREELLVKTTQYFGSIKTCRKNTVFKQLQNFKISHKKFKKNLHRVIMKENDGTGNDCSVPSENLSTKRFIPFTYNAINRKGPF